MAGYDALVIYGLRPQHWCSHILRASCLCWSTCCQHLHLMRSGQVQSSTRVATFHRGNPLPAAMVGNLAGHAPTHTLLHWIVLAAITNGGFLCEAARTFLVVSQESDWPQPVTNQTSLGICWHPTSPDLFRECITCVHAPHYLEEGVCLYSEALTGTSEALLVLSAVSNESLGCIISRLQRARVGSSKRCFPASS